MPRYNGFGKGDELVRINLKIPKELTDRQRQLIKELSKEFH